MSQYDRLAAEDLARFDEQMRQRTQMGYFLMDDGTKSTDPVNSLKLNLKTPLPQKFLPVRPQLGFDFFREE